VVHLGAARSAARRVRTPAWLGALLVPLLVCAAAPDAEARRAARYGLIVKFAGSGDHALEACAARLHREGRSYRSATADDSGSIDALHARLGVRAVRPVFRGSRGSLESHRKRLGARLLEGAPRAAGAGVGVSEVPDLAHVYTVEFGADLPLEEALALYAEDPHVEYVQPDHRRTLDELPNDPFLYTSGSWGQAFPDLWALERIGATEAWSHARGEGIVVAVVDTGLDYNHPDIAANVWVNPGEDLDGNGVVDETDRNGIDDDGNGFVDDLHGFDFGSSLDANGDGDFDDPGDVSDADPFDENGHGTHVSGTIAALSDNGIGIVGVAPAARLMAVKGFPDDGTSGRDSALWRAVLYAAENGARVINNSWSCFPACPRNPLAEDVAGLVRRMGVVIVTSASNRQSDVAFLSPENTRDVITVASSGQDDLPSATFTNFGWLVDVAAPGGGPFGNPGIRVGRRNILSLRSLADEDSEPFAVAGDYLRNAGTSMSAPHVSGVVALLLSAEPGLDYEAVRRRIRQSAVDLRAPGHDADMGAGRLDALAALTDPPLPDLEIAIVGPRPASSFAGETGEIAIRGFVRGRDLESWTLEYGLGGRPETWHPIDAGSRPVPRVDVLANWRVAGLEQGAYVIRLTATTPGGSERFVEFTQLALERNRPEPISQPGASAARPDLSGALVVWESRRPLDDGSESTSVDLVLADLRRGTERVIAGGVGEQHSVAIAGRTLAWLDRRESRDHTEVHACRIDRRTGRCAVVPVAPGRGAPLPPAVAAGRVFWTDGSSGQPDLHGCRLRAWSPGCQEYDLGLDPTIRGFLHGDGRSLVWVEPLGGQRLARCRVDWRTGACAGARIAFPTPALSRPAVSGDLLAWVAFGLPGRTPLQICRHDPVTGECPIVVVQDAVSDPWPQLSGDRLVWEARVGDQDEDVFYCEYDRIRERCPAQRLTADMAAQRSAAIDRDRVVWEDARDGETRIYGTTLPRFAKLRDRAARVGRWLVVVARIAEPGDGDPVFAVEAVGAGSTGSLGAHLLPLGRSRVALLWRPQARHVGEQVFTFSATSETGLVARRSVRVKVSPARWPGWWFRAHSRVPAASPPPRDRARSWDPWAARDRGFAARAPRAARAR